MYTEVILESGASVELVPKSTKAETQLLEQLKADSVKDSEDNKFVVSVKHIIFKYSLINVCAYNAFLQKYINVFFSSKKFVID